MTELRGRPGLLFAAESSDCRYAAGTEIPGGGINSFCRLATADRCPFIQDFFVFLAVTCVILGHIILPQLRLYMNYQRTGDRKGRLQIWARQHKRIRSSGCDP